MSDTKIKAKMTFDGSDLELIVAGNVLVDGKFADFSGIAKEFCKIHGVKIKQKHLDDDKYIIAMDNTFFYKGFRMEIIFGREPEEFSLPELDEIGV